MYEGGQISIVEWTDMFTALYEETDAPRKSEEYWNAVMAHLSGIGEAIRRSHYPELLKSAASAFCWMCCYVKKCNIGEDQIFKFQHNFSEIVAFKFPRKCGHCRQPECQCDAARMDEKEDKSAKYGVLLKEWQFERGGLINCSISQWLDIFWTIYSGRLHLQPLESLGFHLLEEAGEEAFAIRKLIQFRGILDYKIEGIDSKYLDEISSLQALVKEYNSSINELKSHYKKSTEDEAKKAIRYDDNCPKVIKARLVLAKMDFIIELADTFSWFCAVLLKLIANIKCFEHNEKDLIKAKISKDQLKKFHIEEALRERYRYKDKESPLTCYACEKTKCKCLFFPATT